MESRPIVIIVEDEPLIGLAVEDALKEAGYDVRLITDAMPHPLNAMTEQAISNARFFKIRNSTREML